tara:strand:+ start:1459 stop:2175 length:717 start_codon:yes stop_codon:yes gene_type:complete
MAEENEDILSKKDWYKAKGNPTKHKLANEVDRLTEKYAAKGKDFTTTSQYKHLQDYLDGVPAVRGGNLGRRDDTYGGNFILNQNDPAAIEAERERQNVINLLSGVGSLDGAEVATMNQKDKVNFLKNLNAQNLRLGLTGDQYFNFRQQLYNADIGAYQQAFPWSSGHRLGQIMENVLLPYPIKMGASALKQVAEPVYGGILEAGGDALDFSGNMVEQATKPVDWLAREIEKLRLKLER